LSQKINKK